MSGPLVKSLAGLALAAALAAAGGGSEPPGQAASRPESNLEYWLSRAQPATQPTTQPAGADPFGGTDRFGRRDALPGVVALSDGQLLAGGIHTTRDRNWEVWVESEKRWRHIPPIAVLSIQAVVVEQGLEKEWRWKEMGSDEKVYTGREKPIRRFQWRFHLIDDSYLAGEVKGQPVWVESGRKRHGPFLLHERSAGVYGQKLKDLVYVEKVVISRRAMEEVLQAGPAASRPGAG
ncbi:MAG: hypothetical protein AMK72_12100 [Planctomycetes bacterium SM23_25]|jgi:hypothetical protein|nr:MAG: hypothetical protein AMK72_12100 [Planctomycetes bacterium SM23_25]